MCILNKYGWNSNLSEIKENAPFRVHQHGRVTIAHKSRYNVITEQGTLICELTGRLLYGLTPEEYPCTGDWVVIIPTDEGKGIIVELFPRQRTLYRKKVGSSGEKQPIATHVDTGYIVQSIGYNYNVRRIERMMVQLLQQEIKPVLILTKSDQPHQPEEIARELAHLTSKMPVHYTSVYQPGSIQQLKTHITAGETICVIGSSGVGKSTLINALIGEEKLETSHISTITGKGRHTTTRREMHLIPLEEGRTAVLIDTPGVREFGITGEAEESIGAALNLEELGKQCRYTDCTHTTEPGCAILRALESGEISPEVFISYHKLLREAKYNSESEQQKRKREKTFCKMVKHVSELKNKRK